VRKKGWLAFLEGKERKGAEELAPREEQPLPAGDEVQLIPVEQIDASRYQPRQNFGAAELQELARSIAQYGVLQPVIVREKGDRFELIVGERRLRAAKEAGLKEIPALVRRASEEEAAVLALVENLQRQDLDFFEEAAAYERLLTEFGLTQAGLAERLGRSQSTVANKLRLLRLPPSVREAIQTAGLSERHARALLGLDSEVEQLRVVREIVEKQLSVRATDELVKQRARKQSTEQRGRQFTGVYKDLRILVNSVRQLAAQLRQVGIEARVEQEERDDEVIIRVRIHRDRSAEKAATSSQR